MGHSLDVLQGLVNDLFALILANMVQSAEDFVQNDFKVTPEVCQEILAGTFDSLGTPQSQDLFHEANALSEHKGTKGMGHLDPLVTGPRGLSGPFPWYLCAAPRVH
jgi:hypothetical protein